MARIIIAGDAIVIESSQKLADIKALEAHRPKALVLCDDDGKTELFRVGTTSGQGTIGKYGASFGGESRDGNGKATITMTIPSGVADAKKYAEDMIGVAIIHLNKVEEQFAGALESVNQDIAAVRSTITVM